MKKNSVLFLLALFCSLFASAQTSGIDSLEARHIIYSDSMQTVRAEQRELRYAKYKNVSSVIKLSVLSPLAGSLSLHYEQRLSRAFSFEAGAGVSFTKFLRRTGYYREVVSVVTLTPNAQIRSPYNYDFDDRTHRTSSAGYIVTAEPRYYFERKGLQGIFVGLLFAHTRHNTKSDKIRLDNNTFGFAPDFITDTFLEKESFNDLLATLGNQILYKHLSLEYAVAGGVRTATATKYTYENITSHSFAEGYVNLKRSSLIVQAQLKLGYHF